MRYVKSRASASRRGWQKGPGGGLTAEPIPPEPLDIATVLKSGLWRSIGGHLSNEHQHAIFQPVGGMDQIAVGFDRAVDQLQGGVVLRHLQRRLATDEQRLPRVGRQMS